MRIPTSRVTWMTLTLATGIALTACGDMARLPVESGMGPDVRPLGDEQSADDESAPPPARVHRRD